MTRKYHRFSYPSTVKNTKSLMQSNLISNISSDKSLSQFIQPSQTQLTTSESHLTTTIPIAIKYSSQKINQEISSKENDNYYGYGQSSYLSPLQSSSNLISYNNNNSNYRSECEKYRNIVNDMTTDLSELISQVQNQFDENDIVMTEDNTIRFESTLKELENQNDLLQDTIKKLQWKNSHSESIYNDILKHKEEQYRTKIKSLEQELDQSNTKYNALNRKHQALLYDVKQYKEKCKCGAVKAVEFDDKDAVLSTMGRKSGQDLTHIFEMMERKDDELKVLKEFSSNEKTRLNKRITDAEEQIKEYEVQIAILKTNFEKKETELKDLRREFAERTDDTQFRDMIDKLTGELSEERALRKESETTLEAKVKGLERALDETRTSLVKANDSLATLKASAAAYQKQSEAAIKENDILRQELFAMKGNVATLEGTERSLKSQLSKTQDEVQNLRTANVKIKTLTEDVDNFKQNCVRLKNANFELIAKYNSLIEDYNTLADEFRKLSELNDVIEQELEVLRKWQRDQVKQDNTMKEHIQHLTDHIETLSEDRDDLIQKIYDYHQDLLIVSSELDHYKEIFADTMGEAHDRASLAAGEMPGQDSADAIIRKILRTAEKLSHTRKTFQESLDRRNSK
ncbi:myosin heavy chain, non-muscle-like [Condylostylus longicornis]|uniref:myosin heavy chain, non-muscle-like n=1 Tax=Condylostylus longicornis TaxID=2530218 RepID=UPI00244DDD61|nr:myosin heavy chain, non-muscle-like [Condylostylus longicornis]